MACTELAVSHSHFPIDKALKTTKWRDTDAGIFFYSIEMRSYTYRTITVLLLKSFKKTKSQPANITSLANYNPVTLPDCLQLSCWQLPVKPGSLVCRTYSLHLETFYQRKPTDRQLIIVHETHIRTKCHGMLKILTIKLPKPLEIKPSTLFDSCQHPTKSQP